MVSFRSYLAALIAALVCSADFQFAVSMAATQPKAAALPPLLTSWLNAQTNILTWSADVIQTRTLKTLTQPLMATGQVWFVAPDRFRWEIGRPAQTIAVRKPDEMLVIYPRLKRAERYSFGSEQAGPWKETLALLEAGFPRNEADLNRQFRIKSFDLSNGVCQLKLEPRSPSARHMMPQIGIAFSVNDFMLRATELEFADGSTMRNEFTNPKLNPPVSASVFSPPLDGYKIVEPMKH